MKQRTSNLTSNSIYDHDLTAKIEPFDSFWEGPDDVEQGYTTTVKFYRENYLPWIPPQKDAAILVVSCGPGYLVTMLNGEGYKDVIGIDSFANKIEHAQKRGLNCKHARCLEFLSAKSESFDAIVFEQELNHLTKAEMGFVLSAAQRALRPGGALVCHGLNGANPITGPEALAQNFDHYNTFTEYSLQQILNHAGFVDVRVFPLNLYVFYRNPFNYIAWGLSAALSVIFRGLFILYGKSNRLFTKKIAASCRKPLQTSEQ